MIEEYYQLLKNYFSVLFTHRIQYVVEEKGSVSKMFLNLKVVTIQLYAKNNSSFSFLLGVGLTVLQHILYLFY